MYNVFFYGNVDVTEIVFTVFVLFFIGLVLYLRREDRREGYPLENEMTGALEAPGGLFFAARPKTFVLPGGRGSHTVPHGRRDSRELAARRTSRSAGAPLAPVGDPLRAGVGPGAFAQRAHAPDMLAHGGPRIAPLRLAADYYVDTKSPDPRGMTVVGADGVAAGVVSDLWVDKSEYLIRYLEISVAAAPGAVSPAPRQILAPMTMAVVRKGSGTVRIEALLGGQIAGAPVLEAPDQVTLFEEERICAYFGAGFLYATEARAEPWL